MKKISLVIVIGATLLLIVACSSGNTDEASSYEYVSTDETAIHTPVPSPSASVPANNESQSAGSAAPITSIDILTRWSTDIFKVEILDSRTERLMLGSVYPDPDMLMHLIHRIRVIDVFKGDSIVGDIVEIAQFDGRYDEYNPYDSVPEFFEYGATFVFFARNFRGARVYPTPMRLSSRTFGVYRVSQSNFRGASELEGGIIAAYNADPGLADIVLENNCDWNYFELTVGKLILIRYEAGLGPRPYNLQPPVGVDRDRMNFSIALAEYHLPQNYNRPGWDNVQILLDEAIRVRDNPYSRQIHVNHASFDLRHEMFRLGIDTSIPVPTPGPTEVCREALSTAITTAQSLGAHNYTPETWAILQLALQAAITAYETETATQAQINEATWSLHTAINALEFI